MAEFCSTLAASKVFQRFITGVIVLAAVLVGLETDPGMVERVGGALHLGDQLIIAIFTLEVVVKLTGGGATWYRYFRDPWNVFDFVIVVACLLPIDAQYLTVLRLLRLLRVLRLVRALPKLQILVGALIKSLPSMVYVTLLLFLVFYIYGVAAVFMFGHNDPIHFSTLPMSMLSLFRAVTLEDWTDLMYIQMYGCAGYGYDGREALCTASHAMPVGGALFFVSFVLLATMVMLNLFVGVIMNGMAEAQKETEEMQAKDRAASEGEAAPTLSMDLGAALATLAKLQAELHEIQTKAGAHVYPSSADG